MVYYPILEKVMGYNSLILTLIKVKKADKSNLLSSKKLENVIEECKNKTGDIYDKAVILLKGLIQSHPFASGNRRTAFIVVKDFVISNNLKFGIEDHPSQAKIMTGIREGFYTDIEIREWIKNGKIKEFRR